jgi:hypothetical protein
MTAPTVITHDTTTIEPVVVEGYESTREGRNVVHPIIGRAEPDVTLRPANLRTGTLRLVFDDEDASAAAELEHATGGVFAVVSTERATIEMSYVVAGEIVRGLDEDTSEDWIVTVEYQEVTP